MSDSWEALAVDVAADGSTTRFGPFRGLPDALRFVSEHLQDVERYSHEFVVLVGPEEAGDRLNRWPGPQRENQPLSAALREHINTDVGEEADSAHAAGLHAHLSLHRPWPVEFLPLECQDGECDHPIDHDGQCTEQPERRVLCRGCTPTLRAGSEWDGQPLPECRVDWPCSPVRAMALAFNLPSQIQRAIWPLDLNSPQPPLPFETTP